MNKILLVARWEFITTVTRAPFIFAVIAMPLFYGGMFALAGLAGRSAVTSNARSPVAVVDATGTLDLPFAAARAAARDRARAQAGNDLQSLTAGSPQAAAAVAMTTPPPNSLVKYPDLNAALTDLKAKKVSTVFSITADYIGTGHIVVYSRDGGLFSVQADRQRQTQLADAIRASLLQATLSGDRLDRAYAPILSSNRMQLAPSGSFAPSTDDSGLGAIAGTTGIMLLLTMAIFFSAGFLQQATIADRQNRVIEILLSSLDPDQLVLGKLIGLSGAGLMQVAIYVTLIIIPGAVLLSAFQVPVAKLALSVLFFLVGYLIFACLMTGSGMIGRTAQESAQISMIWMLLSSSPWFFVANIGAAPNGPIARGLSLFPLTSPITMMMRVASTDVAPLEILAVVTIDVAAIYLIFKASVRIFRAAALMYGKRPTLPELVRWLRAA